MALRDVLRRLREQRDQGLAQAQSQIVGGARQAQGRIQNVARTMQRGYNQAPTNPRNIPQVIQNIKRGAQISTPQPIRQIPQRIQRLPQPVRQAGRLAGQAIAVPNRIGSAAAQSIARGTGKISAPVSLASAVMTPDRFKAGINTLGTRPDQRTAEQQRISLEQGLAIMPSAGVLARGPKLTRAINPPVSPNTSGSFKKNLVMQLQAKSPDAAAIVAKQNFAPDISTVRMADKALKALPRKLRKDPAVTQAIDSWARQAEGIAGFEQMGLDAASVTGKFTKDLPTETIQTPNYSRYLQGILNKKNTLKELGAGSRQDTIERQLADKLEGLRVAVSEPVRQGVETGANLIKRNAQIEALGKEAKKLQSIKPNFNFASWKDKRPWQLNRETIERNLDDVAGADAQKIKELVVDPIKQNSSLEKEFLQEARGFIRDNVVKRLGIKAGRKADKLVQRYGEGLIDDVELAQLAPKQADSIKEAAGVFRKQYDDVLDLINSVRQNYGYNPIPKREDYFRHFQEIGSVGKNIGILFKDDTKVPTAMAGFMDKIHRGKPFTNAELQRLGGKYTESAVRGFDNYLDSVSKQIFHTDSVQRVRALTKEIQKAAQTSDEIILPNFVKNLTALGDSLAGQKTGIDVGIINEFGPTPLRIANLLQRQVSANLIGGNIASAFTNVIPTTQLLATTPKRFVVRGLMESSATPLQGKNGFQYIDGVRSGYLQRKFNSLKDTAISPTKTQKTVAGLGYLFKTIDQFTSKMIVASKYREGLAKGLDPKKAMKAADDYANKLVPERSAGTLPNVFNSKTMGALTQFQTEINNQFSFVFKDIPNMSAGSKKKLAQTYTEYAVYLFLFNSAFEAMFGRRPAPDPINWTSSLLGITQEERDKDLKDRVGQVSKEVTGQLPFVGGVFGGRVPLAAGLPDVKGIYSGEKKVLPELTRAAFTVGPPAGGGQAYKTLQGLGAYAKGYSATGSGKARFPIEQDAQNLIRAGVGGVWSTKEGRKYIRNMNRPLSEAQTERLQNLPPDKRAKYYEGILKDRLEAKEKKKKKEDKKKD